MKKLAAIVLGLGLLAGATVSFAKDNTLSFKKKHRKGKTPNGGQKQ